MSYLADKIAIQISDQNISFAQLELSVQKKAKEFLKLPKAILILHAAPNFEFIIQLLASLTIGQPIALFSPQWSVEDQQEKMNLLGHTIQFNNQGDLVEHHPQNKIVHHPLLALVLFTSGSTGQVKAVQLSKENIEANCHAVIKALGFATVSDQLLFLPLSYSFGLLGQLLPGLISGITSKLITQFTDIKALLEQGQIPQMWSGVPSHWVAISKMAKMYPESAAKLAKIVSAGAPLPITLRKELAQTFPNAILFNNYGLTEASPRVLTYSSQDPLFMEDYAGYPIGDWQVKLSENQELLIKGKQLMLGYLSPHPTSRGLSAGSSNLATSLDPADKPLDVDKWFSTGDIAEIHPSGLIAIKGRSDSQVNIAGEKVILNEVEQLICKIEGIKEVALLPVADELYGIRLVACFEQLTLTERQLSELIQKTLFPRKLPISVYIVMSLPRNQHGKIDKQALLTQLNSKDTKHAKH